jgi:phosphatidylinositol alpha-1,6-mannosyltransferase
MRWLLLTLDFPPVTGGMSSYYFNLLLTSPPDEVGVITSRAAEPHDDAAYPFPVHRLDRSDRELRTQADLLFAAPGLQRLVKKLDPPAIIVGNFRPFGYLARRLNRSLGLPYLPVFHGLDLMRLVQRGAKSRLRRRGYRNILRGAAGFIVNTEFTGSLLKRHFPEEISGRPVSVLHPGIDVGRFRPTAPPEKPVILTIARYSPRKGIDTVIRAMPAILERVPEAVYRVIGYGDPAPFAELATALGVADAVELRGPVADDALAASYGECSVFTMTPRALEGGVDVEGFGMVFLEANACGRPVVASRSGGVPEAVAEGESGLLVPPDDPVATAAAIVRILADPALAARLAERGCARAEARFAWPLQAAKLGGILEEVIAP